MSLLAWQAVVRPDSFGTASSFPALLPRPGLPARSASRFSGSGWLLARAAGTPAVAGAGQLGGGQLGGRLRYRVAEPGIDAALGVAVPLSDPGSEAIFAAEWAPFRFPLRLVAEHRFSLDGSVSGGPGVGMIAGINPTPVAAGVTVEGYAQAGAVFRDRSEPYVDSAVRLARPLWSREAVRVEVGAAVWGAAQRDVERIDIGPSASISLPVASARVRLAVEWRQRVVGDARPGSGLAVSVGTDF